jgi:Na+-translocating ferredoxin:NAD+ oxidoreductase RnfC subunit
MHSCQPELPPQALLRLLHSGDLDAAIEAGLMRFLPCPACQRQDPGYTVLCAPILQAQQRLRRAWAARDRYRARQARLARQAAQREARRTPAPAGKSNAMLPASAAAILARAKAKAAERQR